MEVAYGYFQELVILEEFQDLEEGEQAVEARELGQFQEADGDEPPVVVLIREEHDERDGDAGDHVYEEPGLEVHDRDSLLG